ncbi:MAG: hypothetical protein LBI28_05465 [Treponema sp.]|jgi:hypothetical protein|nr:hypothetical protein [Treponema sp.]
MKNLFIRGEGLIPRPFGAVKKVLNPSPIPLKNNIPRCSAAGLLIIMFLLNLINLYSTDQIDDFIIYNDEICRLQISWAYPSPLETYEENNYKFTAYSTANYRGFIATWRIDNELMYLDKVEDGNQQEIQLNNIFYNNLVINNSIFAQWFSGFLMIKSSPERVWHESPYSEEPFYVIVYRNIAILEIRNGMVINENQYPEREFWNIANVITRYNSINNNDSFELIYNYLNYINNITPTFPSSNTIQQIYSIDDFDIFLDRNVTRQIRIPLTNYCLIEGATINFSRIGAFISSDLLIDESKYLLVLEMGASNVPLGEWSNYTSGAVQIIIGLDNISVNTSIVLTVNDTDKVKFINNWARYRSEQTIDINIEILNIEDNQIQLKGVIILESFAPYTYQRVELNNLFPIYSISEYLEIKERNRRGTY